MLSAWLGSKLFLFKSLACHDKDSNSIIYQHWRAILNSFRCEAGGMDVWEWLGYEKLRALVSGFYLFGIVSCPSTKSKVISGSASTYDSAHPWRLL